MIVPYVRQNPWTAFDPLGLASEWHHDYPVEFEQEFKDMGIDIHESDRGTILEEGDHKKIRGKDKIVDYNKEWQGFFDDLRAHEEEHGPLSDSARRTRAEDFRNELTSRPKFKQYLRKGAPVPKGMHYKNDYSKMSKAEKARMFKNVWGAAKQGRALGYVRSAGKFAGKIFKVAGVVMIPSQYAQGSDYVSDVYSTDNSFAKGVGGVGQAALPLGPADATATWDMPQSEVARGNQGWGPLGETFLNPASPRWLPTQIGRGIYESLVGPSE